MIPAAALLLKQRHPSSCLPRKQQGLEGGPEPQRFLRSGAAVVRLAPAGWGASGGACSPSWPQLQLGPEELLMHACQVRQVDERVCIPVIS